MTDELVASMATIPSRIVQCSRAVRSLISQVDRLHLYLNGYGLAPAFLEADGFREHRGKISVEHSYLTGDRGDAGKFFSAEGLRSGWHLTCDDDIVYPPDYVERMIRVGEQVGTPVGLHGAVIPENPRSYLEERTVFPCTKSLDQHRRVHILGTGCLAYRPEMLPLCAADFPVPNMADIWFAITAKHREIPLTVVAHTGSELELQETPDSIFAQTQLEGGTHINRALLEEAPWPAIIR